MPLQQWSDSATSSANGERATDSTTSDGAPDATALHITPAPRKRAGAKTLPQPPQQSAGSAQRLDAHHDGGGGGNVQRSSGSSSRQRGHAEAVPPDAAAGSNVPGSDEGLGGSTGAAAAPQRGVPERRPSWSLAPDARRTAPASESSSESGSLGSYGSAEDIAAASEGRRTSQWWD